MTADKDDDDDEGGSVGPAVVSVMGASVVVNPPGGLAVGDPVLVPEPPPSVGAHPHALRTATLDPKIKLQFASEMAPFKPA